MKKLIILAALSFSGSVYADGNSLLKNCKAFVDSQYSSNVNNPIGLGQCAGYLQGMSDLNAFYQSYDAPTFFCMPSKVTNGQKAKVVIKYLENHPEKLHEIEGGLVLLSFIDAFPCQK